MISDADLDRLAQGFTVLLREDGGPSTDVTLLVRELVAEFRKFETALGFYADPATYFAVMFVPDRPTGDFMDDFSVTDLRPEMGLTERPGKRARQALGYE